MKKRIFPLVLVIVIILGTGANAAITSFTIAPELSYTGTTADCGLYVRTQGKQINATLELWHGTSLINSWSSSGFGTLQLSKTATVCTGQMYTLRACVTIDGVQQPPVECHKTC